MHLERFLGFLAHKSINLFCKLLLVPPYPLNRVRFTPLKAKRMYIWVNKMFSWPQLAFEGCYSVQTDKNKVVIKFCYKSYCSEVAKIKNLTSQTYFFCEIYLIFWLLIQNLTLNHSFF